MSSPHHGGGGPHPSHEPMSAVEWQIVLALADGPKHGYAILLEIDGDDQAKVLPGSLYRALNRLAQAGLLDEVEPETGAPEGPPRRVFDLTALGRRVAESEARRLAASIRVARRKGLLVERGEA